MILSALGNAGYRSLHLVDESVSKARLFSRARLFLIIASSVVAKRGGRSVAVDCGGHLVTDHELQALARNLENCSCLRAAQ